MARVLWYHNTTELSSLLSSPLLSRVAPARGGGAAGAVLHTAGAGSGQGERARERGVGEIAAAACLHSLQQHEKSGPVSWYYCIGSTCSSIFSSIGSSLLEENKNQLKLCLPARKTGL